MDVSRQAEAVMLLTVSFGRSDAEATRPLTPTEWGQFASWLKDKALAPDDLLKSDLPGLLEGWEHPKVTPQRIEALLNRGAAVGFALEKWERAGLWVLTRSDPEYPRLLKQRLGQTTPAILFGCGNKNLLGGNSIAVVGSRHACDADINFAEHVGRRAAGCGMQVVSGGAAGVDRAAMLGALQAEGTAIGVLADNLPRSATSATYRNYLMSGDLTLVSPFNPEVRFLVGNAMARNKYIYCLARDAIVVSSTPDSGGTWNGAVENLRQGWVSLAVKQTEAPDSGNPKLVELGGRWLADLDDPVFTTEVRGGDSEQEPSPRRDATGESSSGRQRDLAGTAAKQVGDSLPCASSGAAQVDARSRETPQDRKADAMGPAEELYQQVRLLVAGLCAEPKEAKAIADALGVTKPTADAWIKRLVQERVLEKIPKPVRYGTREKDLIG